ncbi:hypothetical protein TYRP_009324 [Tyrophagus putrescentiae]|nr:hypothetical protein TYRP_009324 [Tyrophagus putrescentiae]
MFPSSNHHHHHHRQHWSVKQALLAAQSLLLLLLLLHSSAVVEGARRRCFACRSRGPLGDCKDQFEFNVTTASLAYGTSPGGGAALRLGLRPPPDGKERCSKTFYANRRKTFYMCFCKGDLCNGGGPGAVAGGLLFGTTVTSAPTVFSITGLLFLFSLYILSA